VPEPITRDTIWTTAAGETIALKDLTDSHLVNIYHFTRNRALDLGLPAYFEDLLQVLREIHHERGLPASLLEHRPQGNTTLLEEEFFSREPA